MVIAALWLSKSVQYTAFIAANKALNLATVAASSDFGGDDANFVATA
jgi:hypothetical protein